MKQEKRETLITMFKWSDMDGLGEFFAIKFNLIIEINLNHKNKLFYFTKREKPKIICEYE